MTALFIFLGMSMFALFHAGSLNLVYFFAALIGLCFGGFLAVYPPLTADYFGREDFAVNYGLVFVGYGLGCFSGPLIGGIIHDVFGSYLLAFYPAGIMALAGGIIIHMFLKPPPIRAA